VVLTLSPVCTATTGNITPCRDLQSLQWPKFHVHSVNTQNWNGDSGRTELTNRSSKNEQNSSVSPERHGLSLVFDTRAQGVHRYCRGVLIFWKSVEISGVVLWIQCSSIDSFLLYTHSIPVRYLSNTVPWWYGCRGETLCVLLAEFLSRRRTD
jgi:hypothetical protein